MSTHNLTFVIYDIMAQSWGLFFIWSVSVQWWSISALRMVPILSCSARYAGYDRGSGQSREETRGNIAVFKILQWFSWIQSCDFIHSTRIIGFCDMEFMRFSLKHPCRTATCRFTGPHARAGGVANCCPEPRLMWRRWIRCEKPLAWQKDVSRDCVGMRRRDRRIG